MNLSGLSATAALGTLTPTADASVSLTGLSGTAALGSFTVVSSAAVSLAGLSATAAIGSFTINASATVALTGLSATAAIGSFTVNINGDITYQLTGLSATAALGTLGVSASASVALTGLAATASLGTLTPATSVSVALTGLSATAALGSFTVNITGGTTYALTGLQATAAIGAWGFAGDVVTVAPPVPGLPYIIDLFFGVPLPVDEDTWQAIWGLWQASGTPAAATMGPGGTQAAPLPQLLDPRVGRLKQGSVNLPYAKVSSVLKRRELSGTAGIWWDVRRVTIEAWALKQDLSKVIGAIQTVFHRETVLSYPSGAKFYRWWPDGDAVLTQDNATKGGQDIWKGTLEADVTSLRTY